MKSFKRILCLVLLYFSFFQTAIFAQDALKRELRGVWVASVLNIDYPLSPTLDENVLKENWVNILNKHKEMGMNALFVQIRPCADALYKSNLVPWSYYLTGQSGMAPANGFDPLTYMIETAHAMGFEFHAWLNPYRTAMDNQEPSFFHESHVMRQHPEWCFKYGKRYIMNPGIPEVRAHVEMVVEEIVRNYNVDGVHFDDYFYPYKIPGQAIPDYQTFQQHNDGFTNLEDWRRHNIDLLIYSLSKSIKKIRPRCQFGISPFGVWRNQSRDTEGSATQAGLTCYDDLYADVRKWCREGWIDYVIPQIYWQIGFSIADHKTIVEWWSRNAGKTPIYVGHGAYRIGQGSSREPAWGDRGEIGRQILLDRTMPGVRGSVYFSSKSLTSNPLNIADTLRLNYYRYPSLLPQILKDTSLLACEPPELRSVTPENNDVIIRWKPSQKTTRRLPFQYVVYRFINGQVDYTDGKNICAILGHDTKELSWRDTSVVRDVSYTYAVTVVDCGQNESPSSDAITIGKTPPNTSTAVVKPSKTKPIEPTTPKKEPKKKDSWWRRFWRSIFG
jgi:uncharacterized lipoprotein YddW (UPF0748 family)